jgi:phage N-6-adenine-methyltransferase
MNLRAKSDRADWCTPPEIVDAVREVFGGTIHLDPCSNPASRVGALRELMVERGDNGLTASWDGASAIYVNPPFGAGLSRWVGRCAQAARDHGAQVILLLPAAVETAWWQDVIWPTANRIVFPRGRISFLNPETGDREEGPPKKCALVYWGRHPAHFERVFRPFGHVAVGGGLCERLPMFEQAEGRVS